MLSVLPISVNNVHYIFTLASGTYLQKNINIEIQSTTSTNRHQLYVITNKTMSSPSLALFEMLMADLNY